MPTVDPRRVQDVLDIALHRFLGVELIDVDDPSAGIAFDVGPASQNQVDLLHGGVICALLDVASYLALAAQLAPDEHAVTHDVSVQLLRPVPTGSRVSLAGTVLRRGRAVAFLRAEARVDERVVAAAQVTKTLVGRA